MKDFSIIYEKISKGINQLPGTDAHLEMYPGRKVVPEAIQNVENYRTSAILALIYEDDGPKMVLTQRQDYKGKHGGQISFPGGKMEKEDKDTLQTALRETHEEIGIVPDNVDVVGKLTDVYIPVSQFLIHPYIGFHKEKPLFKPQAYEVKEIIAFNLIDLLDDTNLHQRDIKTSEGLVIKNIPCFILENRVVWGATALMLNEIKALLNR